MGERIDDLIRAEDLTFQEILNNLLDGDQNLDLKTHIFKPKELASLVILSSLLKGLDYPLSSEIIDTFIETYLRYMVSYKRMSRIEIIKALSSVMPESEDSNLLTKNLK